ncbi:LLM class flavin-dependent oxidoreductase [Mycolicibacterium sphagni]|uniref:LLM class flavin-dependent oxidoreductase n=1 Tax=Mycolicibacterium sphagni TaxID=1786 RepID=UPI0021F3113D|nr:LLM class flavin-dependent oxidoreductase [Mycolicibacterium sphagni]MCV7176903.1 LLM class flavin-dependent oxidoreductase [Mycolicibacterium sphagni]
MVEWHLYIPQSRMGIDDLVLRARAAEASAFDGVAFLDHLETPMAPASPIWEAMTTATWVAARTERLRIGHLVLCDPFRAPAVLAKQAVTLAEASGGRFDLGLGSGSMPDELAKFGFGTATGKERVAALEQTLIALRNYWDGDAAQQPQPSQRIPVLLGGRGPRMLELVRDHADWWNLPATYVDDLPTLLPAIGNARASVQQMVGFIGRDADAEAVTDKSRRRWGHLGPGLVCGRADELIGYFSRLHDQGAQRFYVWFADFAAPESISEFGESVIREFPN